MAAHNEFGRAAEDAAALHLERNGWTILARNWRAGRHEVDIIAVRSAIVAFVEVKARRSAASGHPLEFIDWRKRRSLARAARVWIAAHGRREYAYRFDAVYMLRGRGGPAELRHVPGAWLA